MEYRLPRPVQLMDNRAVKKKVRAAASKSAAQGGEENVLKGLFSQNLPWLRLEDYHRLYIPGLKIGRQWRIPTAGCALSNLKKLTFHPPPVSLKKTAAKRRPYGRAQEDQSVFPLTLHRRLNGRLAVC